MLKKGVVITMSDKETFFETAKTYGLDKVVFELRFLHGFKSGIHFGYFNDLEKAYECIKPYWQKNTCYFTLQELNPSILARSENRLQATKKVTADVDVLAYRFLHVDIDPVRPSGIQATDEETTYSLERAKLVNSFLRKNMDFPQAIIVFSGNGITLDYPTERIMVNAENKALMKDCLQVLSVLFSDDKANIDTTVHNPARIIKLTGTISAKGSSTVERPHRYSSIIQKPKEWSEVSMKQLQQLADILEEFKNE